MIANKRLIMRYESGSAFTFGKLKTTAADRDMLNLAEAFAYLQAEIPEKIIASTTRQVI